MSPYGHESEEAMGRHFDDLRRDAMNLQIACVEAGVRDVPAPPPVRTICNSRVEREYGREFIAYLKERRAELADRGVDDPTW